MKIANIPDGLPLDRIWVPVSDLSSASDCLQLLYMAQQADPPVPGGGDTDQV